MLRKAFLSGLGAMGKKHLCGLLQAGFTIQAYDPDVSKVSLWLKRTKRSKPRNNVRLLNEIPSDRFDVAVFSEPAPFRFQNLRKFLKRSSVNRVLLEKPLTCNAEELDEFRQLAQRNHLAIDQISVNLPWRYFRLISKIRSLCHSSKNFVFTVNGGSKGWGCNSIHYLDLLLFFADKKRADVQSVAPCSTSVLSERGECYRDFGGSFLLKSGRGVLFCSLASQSSAPAIWTICGDHFVTTIDERSLSYQLLIRDPVSQAPFHLYGKDYRISEQGALVHPTTEETTFRWGRGESPLPSLEESVCSHRLLFSILERAGKKPPYFFT